ncbi:hypothetical protein D1007_33358 [Hordeum vulgare]|nr:hypothetical protein D1007_33358 [Hordeum vulgare]
MALPADRGKEKEALSPRTTRAKLTEALGKMEIIDEEATPLVLDDLEEGSKKKWMLAGKVLHRHTLHIHMISNALRPAYGHGVLNLPFILRAKPWSTAIAHQIDKKATAVQFDHAADYLRVRVTMEVDKPLRRWILIESKRRKCMDPYEYDIVCENVPHFCFLCGKLGHSDLLCTTPGTRDENGDLPFGKGLRAQDERKKTRLGDSWTRESSAAPKSKADTRNSSTTGKSTAHVTSHVKQLRNQQKIKGEPQTQNQMYRRVDRSLLTIAPHQVEDGVAKENAHLEDSCGGSETEMEAKKKKPTPNQQPDLRHENQAQLRMDFPPVGLASPLLALALLADHHVAWSSARNTRFTRAIRLAIH